jgi:hypothetical protein
VAWAKKLLRTGRKTGPLHISVAEPEQVNRLIRNGLIWDYQLHDCEPFTGECLITQCFRCYQYGHVARMCRNTPRCGFCAGAGHTTDDCMSKEDRTKHRCIPCGTTTAKHTSWDHSCLVRTKQVESAKLAYNTRPSFFQVRAQTPEATPAPSAIAPTSRPTTYHRGQAATAPVPELILTQDEDPSPRETTETIEAIAKRPRGRPLGSTKASKNTRDIRSYQNHASTQ